MSAREDREETSESKRKYYKQNLFQQLRGFYHVAVTRSFTLAAERMSIEQPSVSLQVQALEREFQTRLFHRSRGSVSLTSEGELLFDVVAPLVEAMESLHEAFDEKVRRFEGGRVVCATSESIVLLLLSTVMSEFKSRSPTVDLVLCSCPSPTALDMLLHGEVDLAIARIVPDHPSLACEHLVSYKSYLVVPPDHPLSQQPAVRLEDVAPYPLIAPLRSGTMWRSLHHTFAGRHLKVSVVSRMPSLEARLRCVQLGFGVTFEVGAGVASRLAPELTWIPVEDNLPEICYGLYTQRGVYLSPAAKRFVEFVTETSDRLRAPLPQTKATAADALASM
jgi:DNA-binding transcriptional LysR family regulator